VPVADDFALQRPNLQEADHLRDLLTDWIARVDPNELADRRFRGAFDAFDKALIATIAYMKDRADGATEDKTTERGLTKLWTAAGKAVSSLDLSLADACTMKGLGWTNPKYWKDARDRGMRISIDDMTDARLALNKKRNSYSVEGSVPKWFPIAGVCFAVITIGFLMYLLLGPPVDPQKKNIFDVLMAFCASASGAFLGGSAVANGRIPFFRNSPITFSAYGGIGIFVVVFLILHFAK
jgi:hypothetical protein